MITILPLPFLRNHGKILIFGSGKIFKGAKPTSVIDQRLRRTLVDSLYSNPMSLLIGALCGVLVCAYTAYVSDDEALQIVAWVLAGVALTRVAVMVAVRNVLRAKSSTLELLFEFGAFAYAGSVSLMAALAILHNVSVEAQMVLVVYAVGYATAIAPRNAGRPFIAIGQLLAVMAPLTGALPVRNGGMSLTLIDPGPLWSVAPFAGQGAAVSSALKAGCPLTTSTGLSYPMSKQ